MTGPDETRQRTSGGSRGRTAVAGPATTRASRLLSVDAFRGATIVAMILVNNPGSWGSVYAPLRHAAWHGWTPTDLVFPFFLFIVGVAIPLSLGRRVEAGEGGRLVPKLVRRAAVLLALGLFLSGYPFGLFGSRSFGALLETWRIPGVLQRIAVCYLVASLLFVYLRPRAQQLCAAACLLGYWALLALVPVPGRVGPPDLDSQGDHLAGWLDRVVFGNHVWSQAVVYDPEGLLSTIPAVATTLIGVAAGRLLLRSLPAVELVARLFVGGSVLVVVGYVWGWFVPINKPLWTSSYAVFTGGLAMCGLALFHWCCEVRERRRLMRPLVVYGVNAITVFVGSGVLAKTLAVQVGESSPKAHVYETLLASWLPPHMASLAYALVWITAWYAVLAWMYRRGLVLKI